MSAFCINTCVPSTPALLSCDAVIMASNSLFCLSNSSTLLSSSLTLASPHGGSGGCGFQQDWRRAIFWRALLSRRCVILSSTTPPSMAASISSSPSNLATSIPSSEKYAKTKVGRRPIVPISLFNYQKRIRR